MNITFRKNDTDKGFTVDVDPFVSKRYPVLGDITESGYIKNMHFRDYASVAELRAVNKALVSIGPKGLLLQTKDDFDQFMALVNQMWDVLDPEETGSIGYL